MGKEVSSWDESVRRLLWDACGDEDDDVVELNVFDKRRTFDWFDDEGGGGDSIEFWFDMSSKLLFSDMMELFSELVTSDMLLLAFFFPFDLFFI